MLMKCLAISSLLFSSAFTYASEATPNLDETIRQCANKDHTPALKKIFRYESKLNPFAVGINSDRFSLKRDPTSLAEAMAVVRYLDVHGINFDAGIGQVNSENLNKFGAKDDKRSQAFDLCKNIDYSDRVYTDCLDRGGSIEKALSCYNTGNFKAGFHNGYVAKVMNVAANEVVDGDGDVQKPDILVEKKTARSVKPASAPVKTDEPQPAGEKKHTRTGDVFDTSGDENIFSCRAGDKHCSNDSDLTGDDETGERVDNQNSKNDDNIKSEVKEVKGAAK